MAQIKGENSKIVVGANTMAYVRSMSVNFSNETVGRKYFQDNATTYLKTGENCTISVNGDYDSSDTAQAAMLTAMFTEGATISGIKFYEDDSNYWAADTGYTFIVSSFNPSFDATDIVSFTAEFQCSGDVIRTS